MSPPTPRGAALAGTAPSVEITATPSTSTVADLVSARQRRAARLAHEHLRQHGLDSSLVRRTLGLAS